MDAVLGVPAFRPRRVGDTVPETRETSLKYMARAMRSHKERVHGEIDKTNASEMVTCCSLILVHRSVNQTYLSERRLHITGSVHFNPSGPYPFLLCLEFRTLKLPP